jgi:hypothetical protein
MPLRYQSFWLFFYALIALFTTSCTSVRLSDYADQKPHFDMQCSWQGDTGTLDEDFTYADGKKERRVWTIKKQNDRYTGTAADVVGEAGGAAAGNALNWKYVLALPVGDKVYNVNFDDWMWQLDDKIMMNRAVFSKFGFKLGEVLITFYKQ